jgi:hypothetical protein
MKNCHVKMSRTKCKPHHQLYEDKRETCKSSSDEDHSALRILVHDWYMSTGYRLEKYVISQDERREGAKKYTPLKKILFL